jgi:prephenate dehydratase
MASATRPAVAYLGPEGTFSEQALLDSAISEQIEPRGLATIHEAIMALGRGEVRWAIVPIENSLEGSVSVTLDLLAEEASGVQIVAEHLLAVRHSLIACAPVELQEIDTVLSHPQFPGQCGLFLRAELARARILPANSTADAVRTVTADARRSQAALGTALAAEIYGATIIREGVQDRDDNETRFVWLARAGDRARPPLRGLSHAAVGEPRAASWKTSIVFWGPGAERPGWLVRCLDEFASREINMTKIESRPRREGLGRYMFFADLAGQADEQPLADALVGLGGSCERVRILGSYPADASGR